MLKKIYVFNSTLQTQKNRNTEEGLLKVGNYEKCPVIYLNHGKQIQNDKGKICGPCVVEFGKKIVELSSIQEVLDVCRDGAIFKNVALEIYKKLKDKSSAHSQFTNEYYNIVTNHNEMMGNEGEADKAKEKQGHEENKQEEGKGFGTVFSKSLNEDRIPFIKSLSQLTPIKEGINEIKTSETEAVEEIRVPIRRSHSVPVITSSHGALNTKDLKNKGRYRD